MPRNAPKKKRPQNRAPKPRRSKSVISLQVLRPVRGIVLIDDQGIGSLAVDEVLPDRVGWKAYGLCSLPIEWVPRFLVVDAKCVNEPKSDQVLRDNIAAGAAKIGLQGPFVMVRSSGTQETLTHRGRLVSEKCWPREILSTIRRLIEQQSGQVEGEVHWIVEEYVEPKRQGHLSNERHLRREQRDWVLEVEQQEDRPGYISSIAVRRWRDGNAVADYDLGCKSEPAISLCLKRVAMWATHLAARMHFEWVWDGDRVRIVQADSADAVAGINPHSVLPTQVPDIPPDSLTVFKIATAKHYERYGKLRNVKLYRELGYGMPAFYVLDDPEIIARILRGEMPASLEQDLCELTKRPLIIRTDGGKVPEGKNEMLPRSDGELRTVDEAKNWVTQVFRVRIDERGLQDAELCLIAHHFIPSVASAWARAEPGGRIVRIEALWGIPEGLYWFSHDTFEVDTLAATLSGTAPSEQVEYPYWKRLRYKGTFVASDTNGVWIPQQTAAPYDWRRSVGMERWLFEIARTTRQVAEREKMAISLMWFLGNHHKATAHPVLPWFHSKSELGDAPKAAPRRKVRDARDFRIESGLDWIRLQQDVQAGKRIERIIVEPRDAGIIRQPRFAEDLASFAAAHNIVVELAGGILSHAYYILKRGGCQVECIDLFGADEDIVEYNKLVRDKIPEIIRRRGERVEVVQLAGDALLMALRQKLVEEALEALDAKSGDDLVGELSDVEEVIRAISGALQVRKGRIDAERKDKQRRRGGFSSGVMLKKTTTPHSLPKRSESSEIDFDPTGENPLKVVISDPGNIPATAIYRRPDHRQVNQQPEQLLTFETEVNKLGDAKETVKFSMPVNDDVLGSFSVIVELRRNRSTLRGVVRLHAESGISSGKVSDLQMEIKFPDKT
jgi:predicted house-cleaning noncanonical NTP pyrophosphatase (MazG superfamily)